MVLGFDGGAGCGRALIAARTSMLSWSCFITALLGYGAGACVVVRCFPGAGGGAAKAFGRTLKPAASVKDKMSFLYKVIPL